MRKNCDTDPQRSRKEAEESTSSAPAPAVISSEAPHFLPSGSMTPGKLTNASGQPTSEAHKHCPTYRGWCSVVTILKVSVISSLNLSLVTEVPWDNGAHDWGLEPELMCRPTSYCLHVSLGWVLSSPFPTPGAPRSLIASPSPSIDNCLTLSPAESCVQTHKGSVWVCILALGVFPGGT